MLVDVTSSKVHLLTCFPTRCDLHDEDCRSAKCSALRTEYHWRVPGTDTEIYILQTSTKVRPFRLHEILTQTSNLIKRRLQERGDTPLLPSDLPLVNIAWGLRMTFGVFGLHAGRLSWGLLNETLVVCIAYLMPIATQLADEDVRAC